MVPVGLSPFAGITNFEWTNVCSEAWITSLACRVVVLILCLFIAHGNFPPLPPS